MSKSDMSHLLAINFTEIKTKTKCLYIFNVYLYSYYRKMEHQHENFPVVVMYKYFKIQ